MTYFSVELIVFSGRPPPSLNYYFGNSWRQTRFIRGTQPDLLSQAQNPSHMLQSLLAEPTQDIFLRFRGLRCVDPHQVVVACFAQDSCKSIKAMHRVGFKNTTIP